MCKYARLLLFLCLSRHYAATIQVVAQAHGAYLFWQYHSGIDTLIDQRSQATILSLPDI